VAVLIFLTSLHMLIWMIAKVIIIIQERWCHNPHT